MILPGVVVYNSRRSGAFVDVGAERNARCTVKSLARSVLRLGDYISNLRVEWVHLISRRMGVSLLDDVDIAVAPNRLPLEELQEGQRVDGVVTLKGGAAISVNIGAQQVGLIPRSLQEDAVDFVPGQVLKDLLIDNINLSRQTFSLSLDYQFKVANTELEYVNICRQELIMATNMLARLRQRRALAKVQVPATLRPSRPALRPNQPSSPESAARTRRDGHGDGLQRRGTSPDEEGRQGSNESALQTTRNGRGSRLRQHRDHSADSTESAPLAKTHGREDRRRQLRGGSPDEEGLPRSTEFAPQTRREGRGGRLSRASTETQPAEQTGSSTDVMPMSVGDLVDGVVVQVTRKNIMVDIGRHYGREAVGFGALPTLARLDVRNRVRKLFQQGDHVQGMKINLISRSGGIRLSMEDPELSIEEYQDLAFTSPSAPKAKPKANSRPSRGGPAVAA